MIEYIGIKSKNIIIAGDSAGAGLTLLLVQKLNYLKLSKNYFPRGLILLSPWIDLTMNTFSWFNNDKNDIILDFGWIYRCAMINVDYNRNNLISPFYSALYSNLSVNNNNNLTFFPSIYILVSKQETLFDDSKNIFTKLKQYNIDIDIELDIEHYLPHVWYLFKDLFPEATKSFFKIVDKIKLLQKQPCS